jgi:hypothetical protein
MTKAKELHLDANVAIGVNHVTKHFFVTCEPLHKGVTHSVSYSKKQKTPECQFRCFGRCQLSS